MTQDQPQTTNPINHQSPPKPLHKHKLHRRLNLHHQLLRHHQETHPLTDKYKLRLLYINQFDRVLILTNNQATVNRHLARTGMATREYNDITLYRDMLNSRIQ